MAPSKLSLTFRVFQGDKLVKETTLSQGVIKIGKVPTAHLFVDDESVSRMHAIIECTGREVSVIDLGSTRGTFVNGARVNKAKLQHGDTLLLGDTRVELAIAEPSVVVAAVPPPVPTITLAPPPPVAPPAPRTVAAHSVLPSGFHAVMADSIEEGGARAIEVAAMLGDTVVGVKHCSDPRGGKVTPMTWGFLAGGIACLIASATAFYTSVDTAAQNKAALRYHVEKLGRPAHAFRPQQQGGAVDVMAFGGLALGLVGVTAALVRARRERKSPYYRIGTAPGVELPLVDAPSEAFPLVAPSGDDFVFNFGAGIDGELLQGGTATPLADLVAQGKARPSATTAGAIELPIPAQSRIRARAGQTTFLVSAVAKPREHTAPLFDIERRTLAYIGGSLAAHLALVAFLSQVPIDDGGVNVGLDANEDMYLKSKIASTEDLPPPPPEPDSGDAMDKGDIGAGGTMRLDEGEAGKPTAERIDGRMQVKNNHVEPRLSREEAIKYAQEAGVLGSTQMIQGGIKSITGTADFSSGFDDADIYGPLFGSSGEGKGNFGMGRKGFGPGGGCALEPCGILGAGRYGTIGNGNRVGEGYNGPRGSWGKRGGRDGAVPPPTIGKPTTGGNLDKEIIKRYIKLNLHKISYCYESELLAHPGLEGQMMASFLISGSGTVTASSGSGFDAKVATCVAGVIKNIQFPKPTDGGVVQVNYPFTFHAPGK
ncbi:MAG TPA: AgmX/PglI C-terminal domain-containing protein [Kofleriaceae bacterium]|nr:AgmX/PglI C-terminal domain-containing protein [Kofleriaceae bacterium]